jgi:hypothetical protein
MLIAPTEACLLLMSLERVVARPFKVTLARGTTPVFLVVFIRDISLLSLRVQTERYLLRAQVSL